VSLPPEVFDRTKGGVALTPDEITAEFELLCKKVGFHCRFHDLRHYHASMLHALGVPDKYIMERGGWGSAAVLQGIYQHTFTDKRREVGDIVNQQYKKTVSAAVSGKKTSGKKTAQQSEKSERRSGVHG
jgi:integrase